MVAILTARITFANDSGPLFKYSPNTITCESLDPLVTSKRINKQQTNSSRLCDLRFSSNFLYYFPQPVLKDISMWSKFTPKWIYFWRECQQQVPSLKYEPHTPTVDPTYECRQKIACWRPEAFPVEGWIPKRYCFQKLQKKLQISETNYQCVSSMRSLRVSRKLYCCQFIANNWIN